MRVNNRGVSVNIIADLTRRELIVPMALADSITTESDINECKRKAHIIHASLKETYKKLDKIS